MCGKPKRITTTINPGTRSEKLIVRQHYSLRRREMGDWVVRMKSHNETVTMKSGRRARTHARARARTHTNIHIRDWIKMVAERVYEETPRFNNPVHCIWHLRCMEIQAIVFRFWSYCVTADNKIALSICLI
jgi:hypothetical protein